MILRRLWYIVREHAVYKDGAVCDLCLYGKLKQAGFVGGCMSCLIPFEKLNNVRDLGGMKTIDGKTIRSGLLFRSGHLSDLSENDVNKLSSMVRGIIDLRSEGEAAEKPDMVIPGVESIHIPIIDSFTAGITREEESDQQIFQRFLLSPDAAKTYMCEMYRDFSSDSAVSQYRRFLHYLVECAPVLWHCTAGKDRAGIASVIIEEALGVAREEIIKDYLRTNEYIEKDILFLTEFVKKQAGIESGLADEALRYLFGAEEDYIMTFYNTVDEKYGNIESFIREGIGVDTSLLREKFLQV